MQYARNLEIVVNPEEDHDGPGVGDGQRPPVGGELLLLHGLGLPGMDDSSIPRPSWACTGAPDQHVNLKLDLLAEGNSTGTMGAMGTIGLAPRPRRNTRKGKKRLPLYDFHRFLRLSWDIY